MIPSTCPESEDGSLLISATGGALPLTAQWQQGDSSLSLVGISSGLYSLAVSDAVGCQAQLDSLTLPSVDSLPKAAFTYTRTANQLQFTNLSQGATVYQWDFGDGSAFSEESSPTHQYASDGSFMVRLIVQNPCGSDTLTVEIDLNTTSISPLKLEELRLQYLPQAQSLRLKAVGLPGRYVEVSITDLAGKQMFLASYTLEGSGPLEKQITTPWPSGIYLLRLGNRDGQWSEKFQID